MSLPHECTCRTCGGLMSPMFLGLETDQQAAQRAVGARALASAIQKIAPEAAAQIAKRWQELVVDEQKALEEFLTFMRQHAKSEGVSGV